MQSGNLGLGAGVGLGERGLEAMQRLMGLLLTAISVEMFLRAYARPSTAPRRWVSAVNRIAALGGAYRAAMAEQWTAAAVS